MPIEFHMGWWVVSFYFSAALCVCRDINRVTVIHCSRTEVVESDLFTNM